MIRKATDTQIRSFVRSHVVRHELDLDRLQLRVLNGSVTLSGLAWHVAGPTATKEALLKLERDVRATTGVRHFCAQLANWNRREYGDWEPAEAIPSAATGPRAAYAMTLAPQAPSQAQAAEVAPQPLAAATCFVEPITMDELLEARFRSPGA